MRPRLTVGFVSSYFREHNLLRLTRSLFLLATLASAASADSYWDWWTRWFRMQQQNSQLEQELARIKSTTGENLTERLVSIEASIAALQATQQRALATIADSVNKHGAALARFVEVQPAVMHLELAAVRLDGPAVQLGVLQVAVWPTPQAAMIA